MLKDLINKIDKRQVILFGVLVVVIIIAFFTRADKGDNKKVDSKVTSIITPTENISEDEVFDEMRYYLDETETELAYFGSWGKDPFYYVKKGEGKKEGGGLMKKIMGSGDGSGGGPDVPKFSLGGISWHGNSGTALINGEPLSRGKSIKGYTVTKITETYVLLKKGNQSIRLTINDR